MENKFLKKMTGLLFILSLSLLFIIITSCSNPASSGPATYTVTFRGYGNNTISTASVEEGKNVTQPADPSDRTDFGYGEFDNWYSASDLSVPYNFSSPIKADTVIYAKWQLDSGIVRSDTGPGGGKIFYIDPVGFIMADTNEICCYLEAAPADLAGTFTYTLMSVPAHLYGTLQTGIGAGRLSTNELYASAGQSPAAKACVDYNYNNKKDWFIPCKDELNQLYLNQDILGSFKSDKEYWSSTEVYTNSFNAWSQNLYTGTQTDQNRKDTPLYIRPIRAF